VGGKYCESGLEGACGAKWASSRRKRPGLIQTWFLCAVRCCDVSGSPAWKRGEFEKQGGGDDDFGGGGALNDCAPRFGPSDFIKSDVEGAEAKVFRGAGGLPGGKRLVIV